MTEKQVTVMNRAGIHARPAALIAQTANKFKSDISIKMNAGQADEIEINAKSIMGVITMAAGYKTLLLVIANGDDEQEAVEAIQTLFENKFEEE
ncbi:MAG TPA: HPr family phosphocarrier protein [Candidatus Treponema faecavium]|nr:HPr family phosphocarrier protein [Candidatus Treponema faecavium]